MRKTRCLMCGSTEELTIHHLLPTGTWRTRKVPRGKVVLCRPCHDPLHSGRERERQWERLWHYLTEEQRQHTIENSHDGSKFSSIIPQWVRPL